ncbi:Verru_Chthon cassette protein A [Verrucomicrobium sp. BvORR034]|uniref:Verru_Chthon cassette protein A n=1 Tax=Verrucomicrobium sp. BvORR034 TaxID=1396418 RepID=UPI000679A0A8|nr:Verru_Chthon cassette protein A [Verrucomicrobium sp. BvORR034]
MKLKPALSIISRRAGIALVLVLGSVALVSMLVVAFLTLARTEQRAAAAFSDTADARNLSEMPLNLAIAQIRRATEQNGVTQTWASQPGMIRVYGTEKDATTSNTRSKMVAMYKLYSDDRMVVMKEGVTSTTGGLTTTEVTTALNTDESDLANWQKVPGMYVDLNEPAPVVLADSQKVGIQFPIADPRAVFPRAGGLAVEGFNFRGNTKATVPLAGAVVPGTLMPADENNLEARLPMPVRWLYQLADGRLVAPSGGTAETGVEFPEADRPTEANPIVGRLAFWTDDDSTKINVNTATEGTAWDMPRAYTDSDAKYARKQPAQNEFSRYPGHPAQTSLSPVFQAFGEPWKMDFGMTDAEVSARVQRYHAISPRIPWGGSMGGTVAPTATIPLVDSTGAPVKDDRLYATLDELVYDRNRAAQNPALTWRDIEIGRFFLTAHSRAPELNLFNKPRILLWPTSVNAAHRNAMDKLLLFLGTGGGRTWYLQRAANFTNKDNPGSSQDPKGDLKIGEDSFGNKPLVTAPGRNADMYEAYLKALTGNNSPTSEGGAVKAYEVPGFGGNFKTKYTPVRRDQILTEMFDFLRWSVNSYSTGVDPKYTYLPQRGGGNIGESTAVPLIPGIKNDVPSTVTKSTKGFGRFPTITEVAIVFVAAENTGETLPDGFLKTKQMRAFIVLEPFSPTVGMPSWSANVRYKITGLDNFKADGTGMGFPSSGVNRASTPNGWVDGGHSTAFTGLGAQFVNADLGGSGDVDAAGSNKILDRSDEKKGFPFYSELVDVTGKDKFLFSGGDIQVEVQTGFGAQASARIVQRLTLNFPPATLQVPKMKPGDATTKGLTDITKRFFKKVDGGLFNCLIVEGDVTRSVEINAAAASPTKGDLRLLAATEQVPATWFTTHPKYADTNVRALHFLRQGSQTHTGQIGFYGTDDTIGKGNGTNRPSTQNTAGVLVKGMTYFRDCPPAVTRGLAGAFNADNRPGDWDNGTGRIEDGPYINKADEGNASTNNQANDTDLGYFSRGSFNVESGPTYSPNRQIASAVAFGSLPSGIFGSNPSELIAAEAPRPWQTLLFCPNPASRSTVALNEPVAADHEGFKGPRDHLWLDLWWMPVVEPYAISEAFSTAGKINMNYEMQPFRHIRRTTGLHAALKSTVLTAITPLSAGGTTSAGLGNGSGNNYKEGTRHKYELRYAVNTDATLEGFENRFTKGDVFRSASEICEIFLVPRRFPGASYNTDAKAPPTKYADMVEWWNGAGGLESPSSGTPNGFELTGDNSREAPYGQLYPRLTTKSNTFTVHYRVQMLKKSRSSDPSRWVEAKDAVLSNHRGSATLERYMDPNDQELKAVMVGGSDFFRSWDQHYRFRVVERKQFAP